MNANTTTPILLDDLQETVLAEYRKGFIARDEAVNTLILGGMSSDEAEIAVREAVQ